MAKWLTIETIREGPTNCDVQVLAAEYFFPTLIHTHWLSRWKTFKFGSFPGRCFPPIAMVTAAADMIQRPLGIINHKRIFHIPTQFRSYRRCYQIFTIFCFFWDFLKIRNRFLDSSKLNDTKMNIDSSFLKSPLDCRYCDAHAEKFIKRRRRQRSRKRTIEPW